MGRGPIMMVLKPALWEGLKVTGLIKRLEFDGAAFKWVGPTFKKVF